jgi:acetylornithine deacetylase/succinyl-diaminopimelate desuccinylase-like protein
MTDYSGTVLELARDLVMIDSRSFVSNRGSGSGRGGACGFRAGAARHRDSGRRERALVASWTHSRGLALSGHMDTVPETGWRTDPWAAGSGTVGFSGRQHRHEGPLAQRRGARAASTADHAASPR